MPVINFKHSDLCSLLGRDVPLEELVERIPLIGADMHQTEGGSEDMSVEFFPDRPDMFSVEGLARSLRAFLGIEPGMREYAVEGSDIAVVTEDAVLGVRPFLACAAVRGVAMGDEAIRSLMELQEKLHMTIGRKRSKIAIGVHDLDKVVPPFRYTAVGPLGASFVPLNRSEPMDLATILEEHEKGREYAHLLEGKGAYPVIFDRDGDVLSFPPIINGALTAVTPRTENIFIDVTGTDRKAVNGALNIVATALAERGGRICAVRMEGADPRLSPDLGGTPFSIPVGECNRFLGLSLSPGEMGAAAERMGMSAAVRGDEIEVTVPSTRLDIMHKVDLFEDVAIGHGFERFGGPYASRQTPGGLEPLTSLSDKMRDVMVGLGFMEVTTLTLSNERDEFGISGLPAKAPTRITNPITEDHTCLRSYLMPSLMRILRHNRHRDLPQRIFEVGLVSDGHRCSPRLCGMVTASRAPFTEIKSITESVVREMGVEHAVSPCGYGAFIEGRGAFVSCGGREMGFFGEVSPKVVTDFGITHPVAAFEIDLSGIVGGRAGGLF
ncbi:MAG: phenylalanine--tRNA ligase subunit beta [Methanomassiliicoccaceae archaeon]|nr:phenylalanine--tRNA ligase subunit beta [Methanomassiliicoccaceae archaeon]